MFLLDSNVVSELRRAKAGGTNARLAAWARGTPVGSLFISAITVFELELGVLQRERRDAAQGAILREWLDKHVLPAFRDRILPIDAPVALRCARLHSPDPPSERDTLIAATALVHGLTVVTRSAGAFTRLGVSVLNPWVKRQE